MMVASARPVGVICALAEELVALEAALAGKRAARRAGVRLIFGRIDGKRVVLAEGGVGKVSAAQIATLLVERYECRALANSGVAGGLDPGWGIGDILIADRMAQHDFGAVTDKGWRYFRGGQPPWPGPVTDLYFRLPPERRASFKRALAGFALPSLSAAVTGKPRRPKWGFGTVVTGDQFVSSAKLGRRLRTDFGAQATEMEGAAVAQVAERYRLPWLVVRALSDRADRQSIRDIRAFLEESGRSAAMVLARLLPAL